MRAVSENFLRATVDSHPMVVEARAVSGHQTGVDPTGTVLGVNGGEAVFDGSAAIRGTVRLVTPADWPTHAGDPLAPYGQEVFVRVGINLGKQTEWVSLGYFRIYEPSQQKAPRGLITIDGRDRMSGIVEARVEAPIQFPVGTSVEDIFTELITDVYADAVIEFDWDADSDLLTRTAIVEEDRYKFLADLATSYAKDFFVDYRGVFVVQDRPDPDTPVYTIKTGSDGNLIELNRRLTRKEVYNAVVARGEGPDQLPVRGVARDMNPNSPTYWDGENAFGNTFGKVPRFFTSQFMRTQGQAQRAAAKMLRDKLGLLFSLDLSALPNPALEPFDVVKVQIASASYLHVLQRVTIPLTARMPMTAITKDQTVVLIGVE